jgi:DNA polymerase-3 subunit beta
MKFSINREQILGPLQQIARVIDKRQTMPVLSNIMVQCRDNRLILTGTDLEVQIINHLNLHDMRDEGNITMPARKLLDICKLLPTDSVIKFDLDNDKVKISSGRGRYTLNTLPADIYPEFSRSEAKTGFTINAGKLREGLDKTAFCMAAGDVRQYLNGLELSIKNSKIKLVASDGHRLGLYEDDIGATKDHDVKIILPRKAVQELVRLLVDSEADAEIRVSNNSIEVLYKNSVFSSKLVEGRFPDFTRSFNQTFLDAMKVDRLSLKEALMRVEVLCNEKYKGVSFDIDSCSMKLRGNNPENDEAEEDIVIDYLGDSVSISFNSQYVLDAVNNIDGDTVEMTIAANASACFLDAPGRALFRYIVMPMRL